MSGRDAELSRRAQGLLCILAVEQCAGKPGSGRREPILIADLVQAA